MARSGPETRELLATTALRLFRERGFDGTTMRAIAHEAGVSLGNAYHYFDGKDALVHELYRSIQAEHRERAVAQIIPGESLPTNLARVMHTGIDVMSPYHDFGQNFLRLALPASSPMSPFSAESTTPRDSAIDLMRLVVDESNTKIPQRLAARLPRLLWLAYLGVTLHWVADDSADHERTRRLIDGLAPVIGKGVSLARVPVARSFLDEALALLDSTTSAKEKA